MATQKKVKLATGKVELVLTSQNAEMKNASGLFCNTWKPNSEVSEGSKIWKYTAQ